MWSRHERAPRRERDPQRVLTRRQVEVLSLLARGLSNAEIARELVIEGRTVEGHIKAIFLRLGLNDGRGHRRVRAALLCLRSRPSLVFDASEELARAACAIESMEKLLAEMTEYREWLKRRGP